MQSSLLACSVVQSAHGGSIHKTADLHIRDPFILPVAAEQKYYLYGTGQPPGDTGFDTYRSSDLQNWEGPFPAFGKPDNFWGTHHFWAPEVHFYRGRYYMFASFKADNACRGTQILAADRPDGPFEPLTDGPITPRDWECLDGTLFVDPYGTPWIVFCHEWLQVDDGEICALPLSDDLKTAIDTPKLLFTATQAKWVIQVAKDRKAYVTDGPFLHRTRAGDLLMLWSSTSKNGYGTAFARSQSGLITGPWIQDEEPLDLKDAGHAMIFRTFEGQLMLTMHQPNTGSKERAVFLPLSETENQLQLE